MKPPSSRKGSRPWPAVTPQRKELYELLEIVTAIAGDIEDAGDDLVKADDHG